MDINKSSAIKSPFSPRQRQSSANNRRSISTLKTPGKFLSGQNAEKGEIVYKTPYLTMETYGAPLPVMVTEALTFASGGVSVGMSDCGWCWLVCGRRVLVWPMHGAFSGAGAARELVLPQTDLSHKADLVVIYYDGDAQMPSCIGVSPEGTVRYWASVAASDAYVESVCELAGQECAMLTPGLVLATTSASLLQLVPEEIDGRPSITCKTLRRPSRFLGGLGRRVSLLFFQPAQPSESKLVGVVELETEQEDCQSLVGLVALVLVGPTLQLWGAAGAGLLAEHDLRRLLPAVQPELGGAELRCADVVAGGPHSLLLLLVSLSPDHLIRYLIAEVEVRRVESPRVSVRACGSVRDPGSASGSPPSAPRLAPPPAAALYTPHGIAAQVSPNEKPEFLDVSADGDRILGAQTCGGSTLVFTAKHGVCRILPAMQTRSGGSPGPGRAGGVPTSGVGSDPCDGNLSLYEIDPHEVSQVTLDAAGKLKTAFLFHLRREHAACRALLDDAFPPPATDTALRRTVLDVCREVLDDPPQGDPRWARLLGAGGGQTGEGLQARVALGTSSALHVDAQLRDKRRALALLLEFLRAVSLWRRVGPDTQQLLIQLPERIAAALALRSVQSPCVMAAVSACVTSESPVSERAAVSAGEVSAEEVWYRRVSGVLRLLPRLPLAPAPHRALHVLATVLTEMRECRASWLAALGVRVTEPDPERKMMCDAIVRMLREQLVPALERAESVGGAGGAGPVWEAAGNVASLILDDISATQRHQLVQLFLSQGQRERALWVSEQARDLPLLVAMCVPDDLDRLMGYVHTYADQGMLSAVFAYIMECGGEARAALVRRVAQTHARELLAWLRTPTAREEESAVRAQLVALVSLCGGRWGTAGDALAHIAHHEHDNVDRMRTAASLSRLCTVAGGGGGDGTVVSRCLRVCAHAAALPPGLVAAAGTPRPRPEDMVAMYTGAGGGAGAGAGGEGEVELTEYDYMKALELTGLVPDPDRRDELRLKVWCAAIQRECWSGTDDRDLHQKTFYRLLNLARDLEMESEVVPPLEDIITAPSLADLSDRAHVLIRKGFSLAG